MGYTTDFNGRFKLNRPLDNNTFEFLRKFSGTRRMRRKVGPEFGVEGEYYIDGEGFAGQHHDSTILDYNSPPCTQPGLWCHWVPSEDRMGIEWDGGEKFYAYVKWLEYIIENFLAPDNHMLNGEVSWCGEDPNDRGIIVVRNNKVSTKVGRIVYE